MARTRDYRDGRRNTGRHRGVACARTRYRPAGDAGSAGPRREPPQSERERVIAGLAAQRRHALPSLPGCLISPMALVDRLHRGKGLDRNRKGGAREARSPNEAPRARGRRTARPAMRGAQRHCPNRSRGVSKRSNSYGLTLASVVSPRGRARRSSRGDLYRVRGQGW
jgi:hypothetical protein